MEDSDKKMEMMATLLQNITTESQAKNSEQPHAKEGNDDGKGKLKYKKEGESKKDTPHV